MLYVPVLETESRSCTTIPPLRDILTFFLYLLREYLTKLTRLTLNSLVAQTGLELGIVLP